MAIKYVTVFLGIVLVAGCGSTENTIADACKNLGSKCKEQYAAVNVSFDQAVCEQSAQDGNAAQDEIDCVANAGTCDEIAECGDNF